MKLLYLDCSMGAAGDMLLGALLELLPDPDSFLAELNALKIPGVKVQAEKGAKCGVSGTHMRVQIHGEEELPDESGPAHAHPHHDHSDLGSVTALISGLSLPAEVKENALLVYAELAQAEAAAHGCPVEQIHFHEVGALDAVTDIVGVCLAMWQLAPDAVVSSSLCLGFGQVRCAHGVLPVPAPATANLLQGLPCYAGEIEGELCTPTGAALLRHFVTKFSPQPLMRIHKIGYGLGSKDFPRANCLRAFWGESETPAEEGQANGEIAELSCNLDDMCGEDIGFAVETLLAAGALDVFAIPVQMKKQRPGQLLVCVTKPEDADRFATLMLRYTTSFGVRRTDCRRYTLKREICLLETEAGPIRVKHGQGYGVEKSKPEYDDLAQIAREKGISLTEARKLWEK